MLLRAFFLLALVGVPVVHLEADEVERRSNLEYARPGGTPLHLDAYLPASAGPHAAVLVVHGGSWRRGSKRQLAGQARLFAEHGYASFAIEYRLAPKHPWPAQIHDCKAAIRWIRSHSDELDVDPDRLAGFGYSAGAQLVALLGVAGPDAGFDDAASPIDTRLQAVIAGATPTDFSYIPSRIDALGYWLGGTRAEKPEVYRQAAPLSHIDEDDPPILLFHGVFDVLVPIWVPLRFQRASERAGGQVDLLVLRDKGHAGVHREQKVLTRSLEFLEKHLGGVAGP